MSLAQIIRDRIQKEGPVSFRDFMEMALYYPGYGYYTSSRKKIGKEGDFYTSSNVSSVFGAMIARQITEMRSVMDVPEFTIVEYGAGTGVLCRDILDFLQKNNTHPTQIRYCIIEKSPFLREDQKKLLGEKVTWLNKIEEIAPFYGCVLSNELVDNFSVHRVVMQEELKEVFIGYSNGFTEVLKPASLPVKNYFEQLKVSLPEGFQTEACLDAIEWLGEISSALKAGYVMTIDYGYTSHELYSAPRRQGTLMAYFKHNVSDNLYEDPGSRDITAHVNFSALALFGHKQGLEFTGYREQGSFLNALGFEDYLLKLRDTGQEYIKQVQQEEFISHTLIQDMGKKFKVLIQQKGLSNISLKGFKP